MKEYRITKSVFLWSAVFMISTLSSCYYDNYDELLVDVNPCDTTGVTYSANIAPIMAQHCVGCHSGSAPSANISLATYDEVKAAANNGSLLGTIRHEAGWSPMPKNQAPLDECTVSKIEAWINQSMPN
jgi:mono/diheme cytochrome c family protein